MNKLVALHALMLTVVGTQLPENIPPQHVFEASDEETEFLASRDAVRGFVASQDKGLPVFTRKTASQAQVAAAANPATQSTVDITKLKKKDQLIKLAGDEKVPDLTGEETVDQLRAAILANREPKDESLV